MAQNLVQEPLEAGINFLPPQQWVCCDVYHCNKLVYKKTVWECSVVGQCPDYR